MSWVSLDDVTSGARRGCAASLCRLFEDEEEFVQETQTTQCTVTKLYNRRSLSGRTANEPVVVQRSYVRRRPFAFLESVSRLQKHVDRLLQTLTDAFGPAFDTYLLEEVAVEKSRKSTCRYFDPLEINTWDISDGIDVRWKTYFERLGFDGLIVVCAVSRDLLPCPDGETSTRHSDHSLDMTIQTRLHNHYDYATALKQQLVHYYGYVKFDPRLSNGSSLHTLSSHQPLYNNSAATVIYLAFKLDKEANSTC